MVGIQDDLPEEEGWRIWTDWYEVGLFGRSANPALEMARVAIAENVWEQGPEQANAAIASLKGPAGERVE